MFDGFTTIVFRRCKIDVVFEKHSLVFCHTKHSPGLRSKRSPGVQSRAASKSESYSGVFCPGPLLLLVLVIRYTGIQDKMFSITLHCVQFSEGGGQGGEITSCIWHSKDVCAEWPPFSALPSI